MDVQMRRGMLEVCVLSVLLGKESYGYRMIEDVSEVLVISESTLYPILKRLEAEGCLTARSAEHNGRLRKYYSITPNGVAKVDKFCEDWAEIVRVYDLIVKMRKENRDEKR